MFDVNKNTIYLDMDNVVVDFDKFVIDNLGEELYWNENERDEKWARLEKYTSLYRILDKTPYANMLVLEAISTGANVEFLTAIPHGFIMPQAEEDKRFWISMHYPRFKMNIGPYSKDKWRHAKTGDVLIDDRHSNIEEWTRVGGIGFLHNYHDVTPTLEFLKNLTD